ncbi:MAG: hypothetical protein U9N36_04745 [Euryarchaeota archaeon]|nr:hypothetical protein [Euryarchaeota archaeon]
MNDKKDSILIFTGGEATTSPPDVRRGLGGAVKTTTAKASEVAVSTLQENMRLFLESLDTIISASPKDVGGLVLDEVEICAQIDSKGNIGIFSIAGAEVSAQGGIKFVLRKKV